MATNGDRTISFGPLLHARTTEGSDLIELRADPALQATVRRSTAMRYRSAADPSLDRPRHVRAASGICLLGERLAVIQDDAAFVAFVDPHTGNADALPLPAADGVRQWDDSRGTRHLKPDLEACVALPDGRVLAFGSGSTRLRERIAMVDVSGEAAEARWIPCPALYGALRNCHGFSGSELNVEGAIVAGDQVRLFNRGNGATGPGLLPINGTCDLPLAELLRYLADPGQPAPLPRRVMRYDLGVLDGATLSFTDADSCDDVVLFSAAAEQSADTFRDGPVVGSVIGWIEGGEGRWAPLRTPAGEQFQPKVEGIAVVEGHAGKLWAVIDHDAPSVPSELLEIELTGAWPDRIVPGPASRP